MTSAIPTASPSFNRYPHDMAPEDTEDTIAAIATPPGRGGIGILRLSGPHAQSIAETLIRLHHPPLTPARARRADLLDPATREPLDQALVTLFQAPRSYTGETVVEIALHGSPVVLSIALRAACTHGARLARPGEFTERAFLNRRLDLTQAEAVQDLIAATTQEQAALAARQLGGALAYEIAPTKAALISLIAELEAGIDFGEADAQSHLDLLPNQAILTRILTLEAPLQRLAATSRTGQILREGFTLALVGRPNAGKSSLFNRLVERDRSIVTATPGTTRDTINERVSLQGIPVELIDTAGLRSAAADSPILDEAEQLGIARSRQALAEATVVLLIIDATLGLTPEDRAIQVELTDRPHLLVLNKIDRLPRDTPQHPTAIQTSALTVEGLDTLRQAILHTLQLGPTEGTLLTNARQEQAIATTLTSLAAARHALAADLPHELLLIDLYAALDALDQLTGATTPDDILAQIFSRFCIGK